jgi:hypothetical protein
VHALVRCRKRRRHRSHEWVHVVVENENELMVIRVGGRPDMAQGHQQELGAAPRGDHDNIAPTTALLHRTRTRTHAANA